MLAILDKNAQNTPMPLRLIYIIYKYWSVEKMPQDTKKKIFLISDDSLKLPKTR